MARLFGKSLSVFYNPIVNRIFLTVRAGVTGSLRGRVNAASMPQKRLTAHPGLLPLGTMRTVRKISICNIDYEKQKGFPKEACHCDSLRPFGQREIRVECKRYDR